MGSSAGYWANVAIEVPLHQSAANSPEAISDFLQAHPGIRIQLDLPLSEESILSTPCYDNSYTLQLTYRDGWDYWTSPNQSLDELVAILDEYDNDYLSLSMIRPAIPSDLVHVNLQLVDDLSMSMIESTYVDHIAYESGDIYYDDPASSSTSIKLTPHHLDLLKLPNAKLVLNAGGDSC